MTEEELKQFVHNYTLPSMVDVEMAKRIILEELNSSSFSDRDAASSDLLMSRVNANLAREPGPTPEGLTRIEPDLNFVKWNIAAREAIQLLHAHGVIIAIGSSVHYNEELQFRIWYLQGNRSLGAACLPVVAPKYRLAAAFREERSFRLTSGDTYLSHLDQSHLPSRTKRCLRESVEAFKRGLYLSATVTIGAASESLWMSFGRLIASKRLAGYERLEREFGNAYPNAGQVLNIVWDIIRSQRMIELRQILPTGGDQKAFKEHADRLLERRNYAIHGEDADEDEPLFTYNETGMLLLDSASYFNHLTRLIEIVDNNEQILPWFSCFCTGQIEILSRLIDCSGNQD